MTEFPCRCGHEAKLHELVGSPILENWCNGEDGMESYAEICQCPKYRPDNLAYLEQLYETKRNSSLSV